MSDLLFVYGSLRAGSEHPMAAKLLAGATRLGHGCVRGRLYAIDWYPGAVADAGESGQIRGDVFRVNNPELLPLLDRYEGCGVGFPEPHEYERELHDVTLGDKTESCWIYQYNWPLEGKERVESGDWLAFLEEHPDRKRQTPPSRGEGGG